MNDISAIASNAIAGLDDARAGRARSQAAQLSSTSDHQKIEKSSKEFESILLASWLESAEKSFATIPGGDPEDEAGDPGKSQFQSFAMQAVAASLTKAGGIGIASMIASHLEHQSTSGASGSEQDPSVPDALSSAAKEKP